MQDPNPPKPNRPLSEISHLFLTNLRENGQANRPRRLPPGSRAPGAKAPVTPTPKDATQDEGMTIGNSAQRPDRAEPEHVDLTPEEFAGMESRADADRASQHVEPEPRRRRVTAVIASHLNGHAVERVSEYAGHLASLGQRIGVITVDAAEFRLQIVEIGGESNESDEPSILDPRRMSEAMLELNHDVDRWILFITDPRRPEPRALLRMVDDWTLLVTCDHDGIVSGYRMLKGLAEGPKSPLSIALLDAPNDAKQADRLYGKLAGVCRQFLDWDVTSESPVRQAGRKSTHEALWCRARGDKATLAQAPQWNVLKEFLQLTPSAEADAAHYGDDYASPESSPAQNRLDEIQIPASARPTGPTGQRKPDDEDLILEQMRRPAIPIAAGSARTIASEGAPAMTSPIHAPTPASTQPAAASPNILPDVIELPEGVSVLSAVMRQNAQLLPTPLSVPGCMGATLAVDRTGTLTIVAQLGTGLAGLAAIATGIKWLADSRQLIAMALPQLQIDVNSMPRVHLLMDYADRNAEGIRPLLMSTDSDVKSRVCIQTYRMLRWAGRTGLLLDAA